MGTRTLLKIAGVAAIAVTLMACAPSPGTPTLLAVTTNQVICGGMVPPPGSPFCRTNPAARAIEVTVRSTVVASGTSSSDGQLLLEVPAGALVVSAPGQPTYMNCDTPSVTAVAGQTTPVTQSCTILAP